MNIQWGYNINITILCCLYPEGIPNETKIGSPTIREIGRSMEVYKKIIIAIIATDGSFECEMQRVIEEQRIKATNWRTNLL